MLCFALCLFGSSADSDGETVFSGCGDVDVDGTTFAYYYPNENTTQYLYETFPEVNRTTVQKRLQVLVLAHLFVADGVDPLSLRTYQ